MQLLKEFACTFLAVVAYGCDDLRSVFDHRILGIAEDPATTQALINSALLPAVAVIRDLLILALPLGLGILVLVFPLEPVLNRIFGISDE